MKIKLFSFLLAIAVIGLSAFTMPEKKNTAYKADVNQSVINWFGKKFVGGSHNGTLKLQSGNLEFNSAKKLVKANFVIDMNTIKDNDGSAKLEGHLKSDDFFGVEKHPTATFSTTKISQKGNTYTVTGNLRIKEKTHPITFPVVITHLSDGTVSAEAKDIQVNRAKYEVRYGSKSFFDTLGDKAIDDILVIGLKITATK